MIISTNPLDDNDVLAEHAALDADQIGKLATAARAAQVAWALDPMRRSAALTKAAADIEAHAAELAALIVREVGKPIVEAEGEVGRTAAILRFHAQAALQPAGDLLPPVDGQGLLMTRRSPRGLVGLVTPFNFPLAIPAWKAAPALAVGNAVLLKPSPFALASAARFVELMSAHLPEGLLAFCPGGAETGQAVLSSVDAVSFTGSTAAGTAVAIAAAGSHLPAQTENGGHNSAIILPDTDLVAVARMVARDVVGYAGQKCTSTRRVLVVGDATEFSDALFAEIEKLPIGDPTRRDVVAGPVISAAAAQSLEAAIASCDQSGVEVRRTVLGDDAQAAAFVAATVVRDDQGVSIASREELFGPVVAVKQVADLAEAVSIANSGDARLVAAVHTADLDKALSVAGQLRAGLVRVNAATTGVDLHASFGGEGASGYGPREQGRAADALFTVERTVTYRPPAAS